MELICPDCNCRFSASAKTTEEDIVRRMTDEGPWYALAAGNCFRDMIHTTLRRRGGIACPDCGALVRVQAVGAVETTIERIPNTMTKISRLFLLVSLAWLLDSGAPLRAEGREIAILESANTALSEVEAMPFNWVPMNRLMLAQLRKAQGVAIFPGMFKAAAGIGWRHGRGVLLIREADGAWGPPMFLKLSGASAGIQLGIGRTDLVLALRTRSDLECLMKGKLILDMDSMLAVGAIGVGGIVLGTDAGLRTCILSPACPSRGLYAGKSLEMNRLQIDAAATAAYEQYEQNCLRNGGPNGDGSPPPALRLQMKLAKLSAPLPTHPVVAPSRCDPPLSPKH